MTAIKSFDPLDVRALHQWLQQTSTLRLLALTRGRGRGKVVAYTLRRPDPELEHDLRAQGAQILGYYTRQAHVGQVMADVGTALVEP
jgi:hypothetical protein